LLKTSGGKTIAPQPIENKLKLSVFVAQAAMVGDRHKFASALISPSAWAIVGGPWDHLRGDTFGQSNSDGLYTASVTMPNGTGFIRCNFFGLCGWQFGNDRHNFDIAKQLLIN